MSETLSNFLVDLASDPGRMSEFLENPSAMVTKSDLTIEEKSALMARNSSRLADVLGASPEKTPLVDLEVIEIRKVSASQLTADEKDALVARDAELISRALGASPDKVDLTDLEVVEDRKKNRRERYRH